MSTTKKTGFKISELNQITNIDDNDLLIVSDNEGERHYTKSMTIGQITARILEAVAQNESIVTAIQQAASEAAVNAVKEDAAVKDILESSAKDAVNAVLNEGLETRVIQTIQENSEQVLDLLDGKDDESFVIDGN